MTRYIFFLFMMSTNAACMKDGAYTKSCQLTTVSQTAPFTGAVTYEVWANGSVFINTIIYYDSSGPVRVEKPTLPFTITLPVKQADTLGLRAEGTAIDGKFTIRHRLSTAHDTLMVQDACER